MIDYSDILACTNKLTDASDAIWLQKIRCERQISGAADKLQIALDLIKTARAIVIEASYLVPLGDTLSVTE